MKRGMLLLGVLCVALIIVVASYGGFGQVCSDAVELPKGERYLVGDVVKLLGLLSGAISAVGHAETDTQIDAFLYSYLPHEVVILEAKVRASDDVRWLEEIVRDTLNRVGDVVSSLIGDKTLVIRVRNIYNTHAYGYFVLDNKALEEPSSCQYKTYTDNERNTIQQLEIFEALLLSTLPGSPNYILAYYFPGFGGYVNLSVDSDAFQELTDWTCEDWKIYLAGNLKRISDILFDSFGVGETLTLELYILDQQSLKGRTTFFVLNKDTAGNPSEWEVYFE